VSPTTLGWVVLLCPLAGTVVIALGWPRWRGTSSGWIATAAIFASFGFSVAALVALLDRAPAHRTFTSTLWNYAVTAGLDARVQILIDPLSVFMILVVSGVSALIHLYSISYMRGDRGFTRYFCYLNYFVFSMLLLVLAGNFVLLIIGWAFVGAASYLLISFWYRRRTATRAGIKAFVINVIGDIGLVLGTFFIFRHTHTVSFLGTFHALPHVFHSNQGGLVAAGILLLIGAFAKSAQVPLHTWLPDAMEGPTPVSSLIHAATMVTAGVYLIARLHPIFELAPSAADVGMATGAATLLIAATIGLVQTDIKRVIAYSTMSQIGYMIMGVSAGAYAAGLFHLMAHAFFKALLFMAAGSIIGAMAGEQSLDRMSGFRRAMPFTLICFLAGGLALSGFPPFSGWFSKDDILGILLYRGGGYAVLGVLGYLGALLTGFYTFRMIFRAFWGDPCREARELERGHLAHAEQPFNPMTHELEDSDVGFPGPEHAIAEREWPMKIAMGLLALLALVGGALQVPGADEAITKFLAPAFAASQLAHIEPTHRDAWIGLVVGAVIAMFAITASWRIWVTRPQTAPALRARLAPLHAFLFNKWYFDELIDLLVVRPAMFLGRFTETVLERIIVGDALNDGGLGVVRALSATVRRAQSGFLRYYVALLVVGMFGVFLYFLVAAS
jgi:NADH-quinone oxidoreductase subunit L